MIDNQDYCFSPPVVNCALWRYMDLTKLLSLLETESLFFTRADRFEDPYEGLWSTATIKNMRGKSQIGGLPGEKVDGLAAYMYRLRENVYISCWHINEYESAAMWKLYLQSPEGVAVRTDYDLLCSALEASPLRVGVTKVKYIDYEISPMQTTSLLFPFAHKRLSFSHENEFRAIICSLNGANDSFLGVGSEFASIKCDPKELIKAVHVSPAAPKWFGELVQKLLRRYGLDCPVECSDLYERPTY